MCNTLILLVLSLIGRVPTEFHGIYLSVVEITDVENDFMNMTVKVFRDNIVDALRYANDESLKSSIDKLDKDELTQYFNDHIKFYPIRSEDLRFEAYRIEGDSFIINYEILRSLESIEECKLSHLFELFPNQKNILKVDVSGNAIYKMFSSEDQIEKI